MLPTENNKIISVSKWVQNLSSNNEWVELVAAFENGREKYKCPYCGEGEDEYKLETEVHYTSYNCK